jgi:hypothetical protein
MSKPGIAEIVEPGLLEFRSAIVTQVYHARDLISLAERRADLNNDRPDIAAGQLGNALAHLRSARDLMVETDGGPLANRALRLFDRTITAAQAAAGHVDHYRSYANTHETEEERKRLSKLRSIWRRSAKEAKAESHRLLTLLCDLFPDAYDRESL